MLIAVALVWAAVAAASAAWAECACSRSCLLPTSRVGAQLLLTRTVEPHPVVNRLPVFGVMVKRSRSACSV